MKRSRFLVVLGLAVLVVVGVSTAEAQLARQGSYSGSFGAQGVGTLHELDAGHIFFVGGFNGVFMNEESGGFLTGDLSRDQRYRGGSFPRAPGLLHRDR